MTLPDFERARAYARGRLERELASALHYHSLAHTQDEVVPAAERFAAAEGVADRDLLLLRTAAWFHDLGFIAQRAEHEELSARLANEVLPQFGYSPADLVIITGIIRATRLPQSPHTLLERIMADSDLDVLGRPDFLAKNQALRDELAAYGQSFTDEAWYRNQLQFIQNHRYFTASAERANAAQKAQNIAALADRLAALSRHESTQP